MRHHQKTSGEPPGVRRTWRRFALFLAVLALFSAPSCAASFYSTSKVNTLRVLAVTIDKPYAKPGDDVTLRMTVHDGLNPQDGPRPVYILWLAGCFDPEGDIYYLCFEQLIDVLAPLAEGGMPDSGLFQVSQALPASSGEPDAHEFTFTLPEDIVSRRPVPPTGPHYGIAYVFFAACAGTLAPTELESSGGTVPDFPVRCLDENGNPQGAESFVPGYTQIYAFADGRENQNPPITGLLLNGVEIPEDVTAIPTVPRCPLSEDERRASGCTADDPAEVCTVYEITPAIGDVAEADPGAIDPEGRQLRESVWISYFAADGDLEPALQLVSDPVTGLLDDLKTEWVPPAEPTVATIWAVVRDQRGGSSVIRRFVRVE